MMRRDALVVLAILGLLPFAARAEDPPYTRSEDIVYGRKDGTALTMDVFRPKKPNGAGAILVVSGGYFSSHEGISPDLIRPLLDRGYAVFAVVHGSQPRYAIPDIVRDVHRAVRFIRHHARDYGVDPDRLGITGASAGGHLSLLMGTETDTGNPDARDPVDREPSRVRAVACFFPPTDFLDYGAPGQALVRAEDAGKLFRPAFDFREVDKQTNLWKPITDPERRRKILADISPITHVTADDAPTLILHGDADTLVPLQQSQTFVNKMQAAGVETKLIVKPGYGHGWLTIVRDMNIVADWFDDHMK